MTLWTFAIIILDKSAINPALNQRNNVIFNANKTCGINLANYFHKKNVKVHTGIHELF